MIFNSLSFFPFFIITLIAYFLLSSWTLKKILLLVASYVFYAFFNPWYVVLLGVATVTTWVAANLGYEKKSKVWLIVGIAIPLLMLGYFKYSAFVTGNVAWLFDYWDLDRKWSILNVALPVGISFYLFQSLSYVIDVHRGNKPVNLLNYALYVAFFPQLVAGPIVRAQEFLPQTQEPARGQVNWRMLNWGLIIFTFGLFQKIILADGVFSSVSESAFTNTHRLGFVDAWAGALAFTGQIFFDFAGYSTCAIGVGLCFGFRLPINFKYPYAAIGFSDFWRRWHISLSSWLRDYLYISLGGNRKGVFKTYRNLMLTMLLGGLWHGAAWTFVVWGFLHGVFLVGERLLRNTLSEIKPSFLLRAFGWCLTFFLTVVAWVFFRASTFSDAINVLKSMSNFKTLSTSIVSLKSALIVFVAILLTLFYSLFMRDRNFVDIWEKCPQIIRGLLLAIAIVSILFWRETQSEFIYFKF